MKRFFKSLAVFVGVWLLGSFAGVMFDPPRANIWTQSLMWALLASVILAPVFLFIGTSSPPSSTEASPEAEQAFEVEENVEVSEQNAPAEEGWPYSS